MLKIAIVDDEAEVCGETENLINQYSSDSNVQIETDVFLSGNDFICSLENQASFDLVFLDIEMRNGNGIFVGDHLRNVLQDQYIQIAIVSGKDGYDRQLFEFRPICFVEKPISYNDVCRVLNKYIELFGNNNAVFSFKSGHKTHWVQLKQIIYFESDDRKVLIVCNDGNSYDFYGSMENVYEQVKSAGFMMIHKSFVINYRFVCEFCHNEIKMSNGKWLPVSKHRKKDVLKWQIAMENGTNRSEF